MKKIRKGKKRLLALISAIIFIALTIIVVKIVIKNSKPDETPNYEPVIQLPETVYSGMEVKNIQMEYLKNNNETIIQMVIHNTTPNKVENEKFDVLWIGPNEKVLGKLGTSIESIEVEEELDLKVILPGNLTETKEVKLIKK